MTSAKSLWDFLPFFLGGIPVTLEVTFLAMAVAVPVAVILALGRKSPHALVRWPAGSASAKNRVSKPQPAALGVRRGGPWLERG